MGYFEGIPQKVRDVILGGNKEKHAAMSSAGGRATREHRAELKERQEEVREVSQEKAKEEDVERALERAREYEQHDGDIRPPNENVVQELTDLKNELQRLNFDPK